MKKLLILFVLFAVVVSSCKKKQTIVISEIKKNADKVNTDIKDYTKREVDDITSKDGGTITGYFREEEVKKIYIQHFGEKNRSFTNYYFEDGNLIYIARQEFVYNKPNTYTEEKAKAANDSVWYDDKKTKMEMSVFYLSDNKLIKWIAPGGKDMPVNSAEFTGKEPLLLAEALIALKQLKEE